MKTRSCLLAVLLGFSSVTALNLMHPLVSQAYVSRQEIRVERLKDEPYAAFVSRSELVARAAIQRAFDRDILASTIILYIVGLHQGAEAPVMSVEVTRTDWQRRPTPRRWATYYRMAQVLLGFGYGAMPTPLSGPEPVANPFSAPPIINTTPIVPSPTPVPVATPSATPSATPVASPNPASDRK
jgi:hypothetical protein